MMFPSQTLHTERKNTVLSARRPTLLAALVCLWCPRKALCCPLLLQDITSCTLRCLRARPPALSNSCFPPSHSYPTSPFTRAPSSNATSHKSKDKIVAERVSDKFTILAPPEVSEIQFSEPNEEGGIVTMTAQASHFHPDIITFRWFCEGGELSPVSVPQALAAPRPDPEGFFSAVSQCRLPAAELERGETRACVTVHHTALKQPITRQTRGFIKQPTVSEIISSAEERPLTLACGITGFCPPEISVQWLRVEGNESDEDSEREITDGAEIWGLT